MPSTQYYALDDNFLSWCPTAFCSTIVQLNRGSSVEVVGIVEGDFSQLNTNKWYVIKMKNGDKVVYAYQFIEWFSLHPPGENEHSIMMKEIFDRYTLMPSLPSLTPSATRRP